MKLIFLFTLLFLPLSIFSHDIPLGIFHLTFEQEHIQLDIKLEIEDIEKAVGLEYQKKSNDRLVEQYIVAHTKWTINGQALVPELCSTEKEEEHYYIIIHFIAPTLPLTTMTIDNDCLLEEIDSHSNIIYVNHKGEQRGFRLHKERRSTSFELL